MTSRPAVLFVCLGNICRSPLAEAAFRKASNDAGLEAIADSAGTAAYHIGAPPDPRSIKTAAENGIDISHLRGRQIAPGDFKRFTHIYALDHDNLRNIEAVMPAGSPSHIALLLDAVAGREGTGVADPYYGGEDGFADTWADVWMAARALVRQFAI